MSLLLDTHALLRWLAGDELDDTACERIADPSSLVAVSAASVWEIGIKRAIGKLRIEGSIVEHVAAAGFEPLPISLGHAVLAGDLPPHHRDPFDRMLVAQAMAEELTIVTRDRAFDPYGVQVLRC